MNIDECESQPCQNGGWCDDGWASYTCHCPVAESGELPWGGDHCQVKLYGCVDHKCQNGATCLPWLKEGEHGHSCLCPHGFYDDHCSTVTTFSFSTPGFIRLQIVPTERFRREAEHHIGLGFEVQLRFRTTIPNALLFYRGDEENHLLLEITNKVLHAKAFFGGSSLDVTFPGAVSDGYWRDAHVFVDDEGMALVIKGPGCERELCKVFDSNGDEAFLPSTAFTQIYIGGAPEELLKYSLSSTNFIGCMEDLMIDSKPILPQTLPNDHLHEMGCSKTEWCEPDPCNGHGHCMDLWTSYHCDCYRPFYGESCSEGKHIYQSHVFVFCQNSIYT